MKYLLPILVIIAGCGSTTDRQTKIVERVQTQTAPIICDTPMGQVTIQPTTTVITREQVEVEQTKKVIDMPEAMPIMAAAIGGTPWGGIAAIIAGGIAAFAGKKAVDSRRQRDELIDGVESAKDHMDEATWEKVSKTLSDNQSDDTTSAVKKRVG